MNLPNAVIMISELFIIEAELIHKVSGHLLDLVVWESLEHTTELD